MDDSAAETLKKDRKVLPIDINYDITIKNTKNQNENGEEGKIIESFRNKLKVLG